MAQVMLILTLYFSHRYRLAIIATIILAYWLHAVKRPELKMPRR